MQVSDSLNSPALAGEAPSSGSAALMYAARRGSRQHKAHSMAGPALNFPFSAGKCVWMKITHFCIECQTTSPQQQNANESKRAEGNSNQWMQRILGPASTGVGVWQAFLAFSCSRIFLFNVKLFHFLCLWRLENINKCFLLKVTRCWRSGKALLLIAGLSGKHAFP